MRRLPTHAPRHAALAAALALGLQAGTAGASTCQDELNRFESRLQDSSLANEQPQRFQELLQDAREARSLRDEERCLQRVAELNAALPAEDRPRTSASPPKAPALLVAEGPEEKTPAEDEAEQE